MRLPVLQLQAGRSSVGPGDHHLAMTGRTALLRHRVQVASLRERGRAPRLADLHLAGLFSNVRHARLVRRCFIDPRASEQTSADMVNSSWPGLH